MRVIDGVYYAAGVGVTLGIIMIVGWLTDSGENQTKKKKPTGMTPEQMQLLEQMQMKMGEEEEEENDPRQGSTSDAIQLILQLAEAAKQQGNIRFFLSLSFFI